MKHCGGWAALVSIGLAIAMVPSSTSAQIIMGQYELWKRPLAVNKLFVDKGDPTPVGPIGRVVVPSTAAGSGGYPVEHWTLLDRGRLLRPGMSVEIVATSGVSAQRAALDREPFGERWDARSEENEGLDLSLSVLDTLAAPWDRADLVPEVAEIIQCRDCTGEIGAGDMDSVGWVVEWADHTGSAVSQEWWLTPRYVYPSPVLDKRTFLRTLGDGERSATRRLQVAKRIWVDLDPAPDPHSTDGQGPATMGGCATNRSDTTGTSALLFGAILAFAARRRRSRSA